MTAAEERSRPYASVDSWRLVVDGLPGDTRLGTTRVGDIRTLLHRIDELEAVAAGRRPDPADPPHSYGGLRNYIYLHGNPGPPAGAT